MLTRLVRFSWVVQRRSNGHRTSIRLVSDSDRRERHGHNRRRRRGTGRGDVPRHRFARALREGEYRTTGRALTGTGASTKQATGAQRPERLGRRERAPRCQVFPGSAPPPAAGRGAAPEMRARRRANRGKPADRPAHLVFVSHGGAMRACPNRTPSSSIGRARTTAVPLGPSYLSRPTRLAGDHRRNDGRGAGASGPVRPPVRRPARPRFPSSAASAAAVR